METTQSLQARVAELEKLQRRYEIIADVNTALSTATDEQEILSAVAAITSQNQVAVSALAYTEEDANGQFDSVKVVAVQLGGQPVNVTDIFPTDDYPLAANPILQIALDTPDEPLFVENIFTDPRTEIGTTREAFRHSGMTATCVIWFRAGGRWQGVMTLSWADEQPFNEEVRSVCKVVQPVVASVIATRRVLLDLERLANERAKQANIFKKMVENSVDSIYLADVNTRRVSYANQAARVMYGYGSHEDMAGLDTALLGGEEEQATWENEIVPQLMKQGSWSGEMAQLRKDGSAFDSNTTSFLMYDDAGAAESLCSIVRDVTDQKRAIIESRNLQQQVINAQRQALAELSTPIIPIMERIIVMPLVGGIDTVRSRDIMRSLLDGISRYRAQIAILDITGVPIVDSGVAAHLSRTIQAARLKGAQTIITGVSDAVAETIVDLGIDWSSFETLRDLQTGLIMALERLGFQLHNTNNGKNNGHGK